MTNNAFSKNKRLLKASEFKNVFDNPIKKIHSQHLLVFVQTNQSHARLGLAITKKKLKLAVERNRLKRLSREYFRQNAHKLGAIDLVLIIKKTYPKKTNLHDELDGLFKKLVSHFSAS